MVNPGCHQLIGNSAHSMKPGSPDIRLRGPGLESLHRLQSLLFRFPPISL